MGNIQVFSDSIKGFNRIIYSTKKTVARGTKQTPYGTGFVTVIDAQSSIVAAYSTAASLFLKHSVVIFGRQSELTPQGIIPTLLDNGFPVFSVILSALFLQATSVLLVILTVIIKLCHSVFFVPLGVFCFCGLFSKQLTPLFSVPTSIGRRALFTRELSLPLCLVFPTKFSNQFFLIAAVTSSIFHRRNYIFCSQNNQIVEGD